MRDEAFAYDPTSEQKVVREHNQRLEDESQAEMDIRVSGPTFAESQQRLASALDMFTQRLRPHLEQK